MPLLSDDERQAPRALVEQALRLVGRIHRARPEVAAAAEAELGQWRERSPRHAEAVATAQRIWNVAGTEALRERLPMPPSAEQRRRSRRRTVGALGAAGLLAAGGLGGRWIWQQPLQQLTLTTGPGQTLAQTLPDGTALTLAARSRLGVRLHRDRRTLQLAEGEARFDVTHDSRPFVVETPGGRVEVLGTVFTVSARAGRMRVAVARGRVAVQALGRPDAPGPAADAPGAFILQPGQALELDPAGQAVQEAIDPAEVGDWAQGWLVFRNTPLPQAVARWNEHLRRPLHLADEPSLRTLRLSGSYLLRDPQAFVDSLPTLLPVRVRRAADGAPEIVPAR